MIQITNLECGFGGRTLFSDVNLNLAPGNRYGIVGANGAGKSTFIRTMMQEQAPTDGSITVSKGLRVGHLEQDQFRYDDADILDVVLQGNSRLYQAVREKHELLAAGDQLTPEQGEKLGELEMTIDEENGYQAEAEGSEILHGLGFTGDLTAIKMRNLSGGYKIRVLLGKCLFSKPDIMLLDEPTNNLDLYSIIWLEKFLCDYTGLLVFISHDRRFLNRVATHILDIDYQEVIAYKGNFDSFLQQKTMDDENREKEVLRQEKEVADRKKFIERFGAKATKARQANSRKKQIERMKPLDIRRTSRVSPHFTFSVGAKSGREVLKVNGLSKAFGKKRVLTNVSFDVERGQKIAVIGVNGIGKSTLLKIITGNETADAGEITFGYNVSSGYFSQNHKDLLPDSSTPYNWLFEAAPGESVTKVRSILGQILLSGDDVNKKIATLSGGEATRLILSRLIYRRDNLLILDEPTNHMDMETAEVFLRALQKYDGTIIFVSHDRYFTDELADHILELTPEGHEFYIGSYASYAATKNIDLLATPVKQGTSAENDNPPVISGAEIQAMRKHLSRGEQKARETEGKIAEYEDELVRLESLLSAPDLYTEPQKTKLAGLQDKVAGQREKISRLLVQWEKQQADIDQLKRSLEA